FAGEIGLSGEVRSVNRIEQRIQEADRLGFRQIYISKYNTTGLDTSRYKIKIKTIGKVEELYRQVFE
ncbi:MAG: DNA repair protein RadA, partial [Gammaproteobacteria bacterium]